ncbi:MAG: ABC transporter substrate-binding protein [Nitrococcus sp.]|nr:ABC transporter substrate-binding protein [Nitrococcus sp.]
MLRRILATPVAGNALVAGAMLLWLIPAQAGPQSTAPQSPVEVVAQLQQKIVTVWRSDKGFEQRFESLAPVITASHDFATMTRFTLGNRWQELSPAQREQFVAIFRRLSITTYADRFVEYDGERFVQSGHRSLSEDQHLVQTQLWLSDGTRIRLDYLLHQQGGRWTIINVLADGVSELAIKRSEYTAYIRDHGFAALVQELQRKISEMAGEERTAPSAEP